MKKAINKLLCATMVFALVIGMAVPVQAMGFGDIIERMMESVEGTWLADLPTSYEMELRFGLQLDVDVDDIPEEAEMLLNVLKDGYEIAVKGTFVSDGRLAASSYMELHVDFEPFVDAILGALGAEELSAMLALLNLDLSEPFRFWIEEDLNDISNPVALIIIEAPAFVRLPLAAIDADFASQYWVMDMSGFMSILIEEMDVMLMEISEEELEELLSYMDEFFDEFMYILDELKEALEELFAEYEDEIMHIWAEIQEFVDITTLDFGIEELENGYSAHFDFEALITSPYEDGTVDIGIHLFGAVTNLNEAEAVPLPELTDENSFDMWAWIVEMLDGFGIDLYDLSSMMMI